MLYIFTLNFGWMRTVDMKFALSKVSTLKAAIEREFGIPCDKQVLLVSGGQSLQDDEEVNNYNGGTDTNPFYLISLVLEHLSKDHELILRLAPPLSDPNVKEQVDRALAMSESKYETAVRRAQLGQEIYEKSKEKIAQIERDIYIQHIQQQGWAAVAVNMEELILALSQKFEGFKKFFEEYEAARPDYLKLINNLKNDILLLSKIPVLPVLLEKSGLKKSTHENSNSQKGLMSSNSNSNQSPSRDFSKSSESTLLDKSVSSSGETSLLQWLSKFPFVENYFSKCDKLIDENTGDLLCAHKKEFANITDSRKAQKRRSIEGISAIFRTMEEIKREAENLLNRQAVLRTSFINDQRGLMKSESTLVVEVCRNQIETLKELLRNYNRIHDLCGKVAKARMNLCEHLALKLLSMKCEQEKMDFMNNLMAMHSRRIKEIERCIGFLSQVHTAPKLYVSAIMEVIRRQSYSDTFFKWAVPLCNQSAQCYQKEKKVREEFWVSFQEHFLTLLFPGIGDMPDKFATEMPGRFDDQLPKLDQSCLSELEKVVPEIVSSVVVETVDATPDILKKSIKAMISPVKELKEDLNDSFSSAMASTPMPTPKPTPEKDFKSSITDINRPTSLIREQESETDTEDFEKVCDNSISDGTYSPVEPISDTAVVRKFENLSDNKRDVALQISDKSLSELSEAEKCDVSINTSIQAPSEISSYKSTHGYLEEKLQEKDRLIHGLEVKLSAFSDLNERGVFDSLRQDLTLLKEIVKNENGAFVAHIEVLSSRMLDVLQKVQLQDESKHNQSLNDAISKYEQHKEDSLRTDAIHQSNLESVKNQLDDSQREIEIYQAQITRLQENLQDEKQTLMEDRNGEIQTLTLEHLVEMDTCKAQWKNELSEKDNDIDQLKQKKCSLEKQLSDLEQEKDDLEVNFNEKFKLHEQLLQEKERILQILEASCLERERKSLENQRKLLASQNEELIEKLEKENVKKVEESIASAKDAWKDECITNNKIFENEIQARYDADLERCRELWEAQKEEEIANRVQGIVSSLQSKHDNEMDHVKSTCKLEIEGLRSRFRMMTTANMEKSPSETSLEKVERLDVMDISPSEVAKLKSEFEKEKQQEMDQLRRMMIEEQKLMVDEERKKLEEKNKADLMILREEKQDYLNMALKEMKRDKEGIIENLRLRVAFVTEEIEKMTKFNFSAKVKLEELERVKESCDTHKRENERLRSELKHSRKISFISEEPPEIGMEHMTQSPDFRLRRIQLENHELRNALYNSSSCSSKLSIHSCLNGDIVLLVWDDFHQHYRVILEGQHQYHFLHVDSYEVLGLTRSEPHKLFCTAEVVTRELCVAKKEDNRFRVPVQERFYRVKVKPVKHRSSVFSFESPTGPQSFPRKISASSSLQQSEHTPSKDSPRRRRTTSLMSLDEMDMSFSKVTNTPQSPCSVASSPASTHSHPLAVSNENPELFDDLEARTPEPSGDDDSSTVRSKEGKKAKRKIFDSPSGSPKGGV